MTVRELIKRLSVMPQDIDVAYSLGEGDVLGETDFGPILGETAFAPYVQQFSDGSEMVIL
jgi:hypothetical protein